MHIYIYIAPKMIILLLKYKNYYMIDYLVKNKIFVPYNQKVGRKVK